jgi:hypothetical protein
MKNLTKKDLKNAIADIKNNLENLFAIGFYSPDEYKNNLDKIENIELYLTFEN